MLPLAVPFLPEYVDMIFGGPLQMHAVLVVDPAEDFEKERDASRGPRGAFATRPPRPRILLRRERRSGLDGSSAAPFGLGRIIRSQTTVRALRFYHAARTHRGKILHIVIFRPPADDAGADDDEIAAREELRGVSPAARNRRPRRSSSAEYPRRGRGVAATRLPASKFRGSRT